MNLDILLTQLFPGGYKIDAEETVFYGEGQTSSGPVTLIGTTDHTVIGIKEILRLSRYFLQVMHDFPQRPILMLVDNNGQKMALADELLGLNQYIAHLLKLQDQARRLGHRIMALVYGNSIAGGFIAFGLCAGHTYALPDCNTSVMILPAIARVTKLPLEYLEKLSTTIPVFAPGVKNFFQTGGLNRIWDGDLNKFLEQALSQDQSVDHRAIDGAARGGRPMAAKITAMVTNA